MPYPMTYTRPRTTAELNKLAAIEFNPQINIKHYIRSAELLIKQARVYRSEGDLENAYVLYLKYTSLGIAELPKHPAYKNPENKKQIKTIKLNCLEALDALETLKPRLDAAYREHTENLRRRQESHRTEVPTTTTGYGRREEKQAYLADEKDTYAKSASQRISADDSSKTQVEEDGYGEWSMQKTLEGVVGVCEKNASRAPVRYPLAQYPQPVLQNQSDRFVYKEITRPSQPPPLPPKPVMDHNMEPERDVYPALPERDHNHYPSAGPALPPKIRLVGEQQQQLEEESSLSLATTERGVPLRTLNVPKEIHEKFMMIARSNTEKNIETCGILCGKLKNNVLRITTLIIPKQSGTPDTCTTENEEEVFEYQDSQDLLTLGWIHTHPSQSCFLSSLDLHTHCSYQLMLPEAIAIVCAPKHNPNFGVFRLTDPPGLSLISECRAQGAFHPHPDMPIYTDTHDDTGHVRMTNDGFKTVDLRSQQ